MKIDRPVTQLTTERLALRWFTSADAELMLKVWNDPAFVRFVGDRGIRTLDEATAALDAGALAMYRDFGYGPFRVSLKSGDEPIGICGLFKRDYLDDPDIGFGLLPEYCRNGYAFEAASAVMDDARSAGAFNRITAIVSPDNAASIGLIGKLGLSLVERMQPPGSDSDVLLYAVDLE